MNENKIKSENARAEHQALRQEILHADRTCLILMGYLVTATGAAGSIFINSGNSFAGWILSPIWLIGFWYFTEKRFVIKRNGLYIDKHIEEKEVGYGWHSFLRNLRKSGVMRPALPFGPYLLEAIVSGLVILSVPIIGTLKNNWSYFEWYFISSFFLFLFYMYVAIKSLREYYRYSVQ